MNKYNARDVLKNFLKQRNETLVHAVDLMNANHPGNQTTAQNLTNKLARNTIRFSEVMEIADVLGCEIVFQEIGSPQPEPKQEPIPEQAHTPTTKEERIIDISERINTRFTVVKGIYFPEILIIGNNCMIAASNLNLAISTNTAKGKSQKGMLGEILQCAYIEGAFDVTVYPCGNTDYEKEID